MTNESFAEKELPLPDDLSLDRMYWWLMSQMLYPDSRKRALGAFTADLIEHEFKDRDPDFIVDIPLAWIRALIVLPSFEERVKIEKRAWKDGMTVGTVLSLVYSMHQAGVSEPSLNKAMEVLDGGGFGDTVHRGTKEIRQALKRMAPFAHLWAANAMLCYTDKSPNVVPGLDGLNLFLSWAVTIRQFGISHKTSHGPKAASLIDRSECFALPDRFTPASHEEISLPLPEWVTSILRDYRAPVRY